MDVTKGCKFPPLGGVGLVTDDITRENERNSVELCCLQVDHSNEILLIWYGFGK